MLKISDFYLDKQKSFIPKKILSVPCTMDSSFFRQQMTERKLEKRTTVHCSAAFQCSAVQLFFAVQTCADLLWQAGTQTAILHMRPQCGFLLHICLLNICSVLFVTQFNIEGSHLTRISGLEKNCITWNLHQWECKESTTNAKISHLRVHKPKMS